MLVEDRIARREFTDKQEITRQVTETVVAAPHGMVNVVAPKRGPAEAPGGVGGDAGA